MSHNYRWNEASYNNNKKAILRVGLSSEMPETLKNDFVFNFLDWCAFWFKYLLFSGLCIWIFSRMSAWLRRKTFSSSKDGSSCWNGYISHSLIVVTSIFVVTRYIITGSQEFVSIPRTCKHFKFLESVSNKSLKAVGESELIFFILNKDLI